MKTEVFSVGNKNELFSKACSMHDCSFAAALEQNTLVLTFDNLENYYDSTPFTYWFDGYHKLSIKYHNTGFVTLSLKHGKKEKEFYDTVEPLKEKELIMHKYSVDSFNQMTLDFYVMFKKKIWGGKIDIAPEKIEYIWE